MVIFVQLIVLTVLGLALAQNATIVSNTTASGNVTIPPATTSSPLPPSKKTPLKNNEVQIQAVPGEIECLFKEKTSDKIKSFISLTLSLSPVPNDNQFNEVAMVTVFGGNTVDIKDASVGGVVTGSTSGGNPFIHFKWHYPNKAPTGKYKCDAFGLDKHGHPITVTNNATVTSSGSDLPSAIHEIKELQETAKKCLATTDEWLTTIWGSIHHNSTTFTATGHRYFLTQDLQVNATYANRVCKVFGGYLAEIEDNEEFKFVIKFIGDSKVQNVNVQVGGSDTFSEGSWRFNHSGDVLRFFKWAPTYPKSDDGADCLNVYSNWIYSDPRYGRDWHLDYTGSGFQDRCCDGCQSIKFLCEIP